MNNNKTRPVRERIEPTMQPTHDEVVAQYAPKPKSFETASENAEIADELERAAHELNARAAAENVTKAASHLSEPKPDFVRLAEDCAQGMVESANSVVIDAQNNYERAKLEAEAVLAQARELAERLNSVVNKHRKEIAEFKARVNTLSVATVKAHDIFHGSDK